MKKLPSKEEFERIVQESHSKSDLAKRLGFSYYGGASGKFVGNLLTIYPCSIAHFEPGKDRHKYQIVKKICPICSIEFGTQLGHRDEKTCCSISCSNSFQPKQSTEFSKKKTSESINRFYEVNPHRLRDANLCIICRSSFRKKNTQSVTCSQNCWISYRTSRLYRDKLAAVQKRLIDSGQHKGWASRSKLNRSFPEQYIEMLLKQEFDILKGREYQPELKQGKWFIDFAFFSKKIALEIDGKQHEFPERKASDIEKDKYLVGQGWTVHRVKWKRIRSKQDREAVISTLKQILF